MLLFLKDLFIFFLCELFIGIIFLVFLVFLAVTMELLLWAAGGFDDEGGR